MPGNNSMMTGAEQLADASVNGAMPSPPAPQPQSPVLEREANALLGVSRGIKKYAPYSPRTLTASLGRELEKYEQLCDAMESHLLRSMSVLKRDLAREERQTRQAEQATIPAHTSKSNPVLIPSVEASDAILQCRKPQFGSHRDAGLHPSQADVVELHGMGTIVGDATEVNRAGAVFAEGRDGRDVLIGSVESNVGHGGAYMTSLVKVVMMLENKQVLPKGYFKKPSSRIDLVGFGGIASVSSYGFGGAGGHTFLREHEPRPILSENITLREPLYLFAIGGLSVKGCSTLVDKYKEECTDIPPLALCKHLGNRTRQLTWRTFDIADSIQAATFPDPDLVPKRPSPLVFCFSGCPMTLSMSVTACTSGAQGNLSWATGLFKPGAPKDSPLAKSLMWPSHITSIALTFFQIALFDLLISLGLKPSGIVGHSVGEMAVLYASGAIPRSMQLSNLRLFVNRPASGFPSALPPQPCAPATLLFIAGNVYWVRTT
ncbi:hypothetical protein BU15DRAFT_78153 [Melanogaster broomeanus]|nr:hypothetical protein BU15DRAFT_78153 [Melanogaster broomeanus]